MPVNNEEAENKNRIFWDEVAPVHFRSYEIDKLRAGISHIDEIQKRELYPVNGKELIHLQCHIGTDTLSLALDGAKVTGVDFSEKSLQLARQLAQELGLEAEFIQSNVLDLKNIISKKYDIVYTSKGVLSWIRDINLWAETISHLLKDGGIFYILEVHPVMYMLDDTVQNSIRIKYPYFHRNEPLIFDDDHPDYADKTYIPKNKTCEWTWSLSDIINALTRNGMQLEFLNEYDKLFYQGLPAMEPTDDGWWRFKQYGEMIPCTFSLRARKKNLI